MKTDLARPVKYPRSTRREQTIQIAAIPALNLKLEYHLEKGKDHGPLKQVESLPLSWSWMYREHEIQRP